MFFEWVDNVRGKGPRDQNAEMHDVLHRIRIGNFCTLFFTLIAGIVGAVMYAITLGCNEKSNGATYTLYCNSNPYNPNHSDYNTRDVLSYILIVALWICVLFTFFYVFLYSMIGSRTARESSEVRSEAMLSYGVFIVVPLLFAAITSTLFFVEYQIPCNEARIGNNKPPVSLEQHHNQDCWINRDTDPGVGIILEYVLFKTFDDGINGEILGDREWGEAYLNIAWIIAFSVFVLLFFFQIGCIKWIDYSRRKLNPELNTVLIEPPIFSRVEYPSNESGISYTTYENRNYNDGLKYN
jgi:magnesium-transporting ATPase (P-type)